MHIIPESVAHTAVCTSTSLTSDLASYLSFTEWLRRTIEQQHYCCDCGEPPSFTNHACVLSFDVSHKVDEVMVQLLVLLGRSCRVPRMIYEVNLQSTTTFAEMTVSFSG